MSRLSRPFLDGRRVLVDDRLGWAGGGGDGLRFLGVDLDSWPSDFRAAGFEAALDLDAKVLLAEAARCLAVWLDAAWLLAEPCLSLDGGLFCEYDFLVILLSLFICSNGTVLRRPDFRLPPSIMVVGPSASNFFHGGDSTILRVFDPGGGGVESRTLRRFAGLSSSGVSAARACPLVSPFPRWPLVWPLVLGACIEEKNISSVGESGGVDSADKGESGDESAVLSCWAAAAGVWRVSVMMGEGRRGDFDGGGSPFDGRWASASASTSASLSPGAGLEMAVDSGGC